MEKRKLIIIILAIACGMAVVAAGVFLASFLPQREANRQTQVLKATPGLGEVGARCGGEMRLPCRPGNACQITNVTKGEGLCFKVTDDPAPVKP